MTAKTRMRPTLLLASLFLALSSPADTEGPYTYSVADNKATITGFNASFSGALAITNSLGGTPVTSIGYHAFYNCTTLTSVTIPDSVTEIGEAAFFWCYSLTSVTIPAGVTSIGDYAFRGCTALTPVTVPAGVTYIGDYAFSDCASLASVYIQGDAPGDVSSTAFSSTSATIYYFPNTFGWSDPFAGRPAKLLPLEFNNSGDCIAITWLDTSFTGHLPIPAVLDGLPVTTIGDSAFAYCTALTSVTIPAGVTYIGSGAFCGCTALTPVTVPAGVTYIGDYAFRDCTALDSVYIQGDAPGDVSSTAFPSTPATIYYFPNTFGWSDTFAGRPTLLWNPTIQHDASFGFTSDRFGFNITGTTNIPVVVEASTNLASGAWTHLTNANLGTEGSLHFSDPSSSNAPTRFYRIVWP